MKYRLAYNRRSPPMAWGDKKTTRDDTNHPTPRKLPSNGYAKPEQRAADAAINALSEEARTMIDRGDWPPSSMLEHPPVNFTTFEHEMTRDRIADIKQIVCKLTYGEMMEMAQMWADSMPAGTVDKDSFKLILPPTLHAWATA